MMPAALKFLVNDPPMPDRQCGACTSCCELKAVDFPDGSTKPPDTRCQHQCDGCAIYQDRPQPCRDFACLWRLGSVGLDERHRPSSLGLMWTTAQLDSGAGPVEILGCYEVWAGAVDSGAAHYQLERVSKIMPVLLKRHNGPVHLLMPAGMQPPPSAVLR